MEENGNGRNTKEGKERRRKERRLACFALKHGGIDGRKEDGEKESEFCMLSFNVPCCSWTDGS